VVAQDGEGDEGEEEQVGSGVTFSPVNCGYTRDTQFFTVEDADETGQEASVVDVYVSWDSASLMACPLYEWRAGRWSDCDVDCGFGFAWRDVTCTTLDGEEVPESRCPEHMKPTDRRDCDAGVCRWHSSEWSPCDRPCNGGMMNRLLTCKNKGGYGREVADYMCGSKPNTAAECNVQPCPAANTYFYWEQPWTECTRECGGGSQVR
jgi:hypothetical protein